MRTSMVVSVIVLSVALGTVTVMGLGQTEASASSHVSAGEPARSTIGTFVFEQGTSLALEIEREDPCPCMCDSLYVTGFRVVDELENTVFVDEGTGDQRLLDVPHEEWIGRWDLASEQGNPVPHGTYTVIVETTMGEFRAYIRVVVAGMASQMGRVSSKALVCGAGLTVYRTIDQQDDGGRIVLREGERLMVALPGNPTTGYGWEVEEEPTGGILQRLEGVDYRPSSRLVGAGGTFYFRYEAVALGDGDLTLAYRRPWEALPPEERFSITVVVQ